MTKLIIFDCDGVLVDTEIVASRIAAEVVTRHGYPITTEEFINKFTGMGDDDVFDIVHSEAGKILPQNIQSLVIKEISDALSIEVQSLIRPLLEDERILKINKCVASNNLRKHVLAALQVSKQDHFFHDDHVFTSAQVAKGKPAPDLFLFAAKQMGYQPKDCLVVEDSIAGIQAAKAAHMPVIGFVGGGHANLEWYKEQIKDHEIPIAHNSLELLEAIIKYMSL